MPMKLITILMVLALPFSAIAQIPNGEFESLEGWHITEGPHNLKLTQDGYIGSSALIWSSDGSSVTLESHEKYPFGGADNPGGHPSPNKVAILEGTYRFDNPGGKCSEPTVTVLVFHYNSSGDPERLASGSGSLETSDDFSNFMIDVETITPITEDARVLVSITTGTGCDSGNCCYLYLDNLRLGGSKPPHQRTDTPRNGRSGRK